MKTPQGNNVIRKGELKDTDTNYFDNDLSEMQ